MADNASDTYGNQIALNYFRQLGNAIEFYGITGQTPTQSKVAGNTFRTNSSTCVGLTTVATSTAGECDNDELTPGHLLQSATKNWAGSCTMTVSMNSLPP